jgi:hypothetical protein
MDNLTLQHVDDNSVNRSPLAVSQTAICAKVDPGGLLRNLRDTPMTEQTISRILKIGHFSRSTATGGSTRPFSFLGHPERCGFRRRIRKNLGSRRLAN